MSTSHGMSSRKNPDPTYVSWNHMLQRCTNPRNHAFPQYGGRGIGVFHGWRGPGGFERFLAHMGARPKNATLDRIDGTRGYEPGNCRWATRVEQQNNRSTVLRVTIDGETRSLAEWCRIHGVSRHTAWSRIHKAGWPAVQAVTVAADKRNRSW